MEFFDIPVSKSALTEAYKLAEEVLKNMRFGVSGKVSRSCECGNPEWTPG